MPPFFNMQTFLAPADQFCTDQQDSEEPCSRSDLLAFQVASGTMMVFMGVSGFLAWHWTKRAHAYTSTPEGRLFGYLEEADLLTTGICIFQMWDFFASMLIPEHCTVVFMAHHFLAGATALFSLEYQMVHYYAIFFGGCSEISSIFLVLCDFDVYFPSSGRSSGTWGLCIFLCQAAFAFSFLYYRIIGWWMVSFRLWSDVAHVCQKNASGSCSAEEYRPGKIWWFLYVFLAMDTMLGILQVYWFGIGIVPKVIEILSQ
jgi:hypothetical protein